jgi:hypothetical protein
VARASAAAATGAALPVVSAQFQSSFDGERQAWLRRWAIIEAGCYARELFIST